MQNDIIDMIEPTPKLKTKKCRFVSFLIMVFLRFGVVIVGLVTWYVYDYFMALLSLFFAFIVMGIIRSKMRNSSIPFSQREFQYNDKGIADWFSALRLCVGEDDD